MISRVATIAIAIAITPLLSPATSIAQDDWDGWRGPSGNGVASESQKPPVQWSEENNMIWNVKIPGHGHASPVILKDNIYLATGDAKLGTQSVACYSRSNGKQLWSKVVNTGNLPARIHRSNSHASGTIATDRKSVFAVLNNNDRLKLYSLTLDGELNWEQDLGAYKTKFQFGYGSSPIVYKDLVIGICENQVSGKIRAFHTNSGEQAWEIDRQQMLNWSTPIVAKNLGGRDQLLISGGKKINSFDPSNGQPIWDIDAAWLSVCGTVVWSKDRVFASGGYPEKQTLAVDLNKQTEAWSNPIQAYEQSMVVDGDYVYCIAETGILHCWRGSDGLEMWNHRMSRRWKVSASPVLAGGNLYLAGEDGQVFVVEATPEKFNLVAQNKLGNEIFASFAVCGNQIFARYALRQDGVRQEYLCCIGEK